MSTPTHLSLFSGIGGMDLGLDRAGFRTIGQVELDPYCRSVLARHWPEVPRHDDVRTVPAWWRSEPREPVSLVSGGFPCQPFSHAGNQLGMADERWGWPWMRDVIAAVRPQFVIAENVPGLLSDTEAFATILADLSALGFSVEWSILSACQMGAPHMRKRLFTVAHAGSFGRIRGTGSEGTGGQAPERSETGSDPGDKGRSLIPARPASHWGTEPELDRMANGIPNWSHRSKAIGNAVVPQVAEFVGRMILERAEAA